MTRTGCSTPQNLAKRLRSLVDVIDERGLCTRPGANPDYWFPEVEPFANATTQRCAYERRARSRCSGCPAQPECMEAFLIEEGDHLELGFEPHGIRAGLAPWARYALILASKNACIIEEAA